MHGEYQTQLSVVGRARPDLYHLQSILKCSTCRQNMRSTILTKCLHSAFSSYPYTFLPVIKIYSRSVLQVMY